MEVKGTQLMDDLTRPGPNPGAQPPGASITRRMDSWYPPPEQPQPAYPYNQAGPNPAPAPYAPAPVYSVPAAGPAPYMPPVQYAPSPVPQPYPAYQIQYTVVPAAYSPVSVRGATGYAANPPVADPTAAAVIEILAGLFGLLGLGHILAGRVVPGLILLLTWMFIGIPFIWFVLPVFTLGLGACLSVPLWLAIPIVSGLFLRSELIGQTFGRRP